MADGSSVEEAVGNDKEYSEDDNLTAENKGKGKAAIRKRSADGDCTSKKALHKTTNQRPDNQTSLEFSNSNSLDPKTVAIELGEASTPILNRFIQFVKDNAITCKVLLKYTPKLDVVSLVLDLPRIHN